MIVGTAYFLDGHTEPIYSCKNLGDRIDFTTISGNYVFTHELLKVSSEKSITGFFITAAPKWLMSIGGLWQRTDIFDRIELDKELTQSGKTLDSNKEMSVMRKER